MSREFFQARGPGADRSAATSAATAGRDFQP